MGHEPIPVLDLRDPVLLACKEASAAIFEVRARFLKDGDIGTRAKEDRSPVTQADLAAHQILRAALPRIRDVPVVSEEGDPPGRSDGPHWLVDPLDGTKEFLAGRDEFTVNVALIERDRSVLGVVMAPTTGHAYAGVPGVGAWQQDPDPEWRPIEVSSLQKGDPCRVVVSRSHRSGPLDAFTRSLEKAGHAVEEVSVGSSLKLCQVAAGRAHVYPRFGPTMHWDTAAAHAVVVGAGGSVTDPDGDPLGYPEGNRKNPWFIVGGRTWRPWTTFLEKTEAER